MTKKRKYMKKEIIIEEPDEVESNTTSSVVPTVDSLEGLTTRVEDLESKPDFSTELIDRRLEDVEVVLAILKGEFDSHSEHLPVKGPSTPRRYNTYVVKVDGERIAKIAKAVLGNSGRYVEIAALNGLKPEDELKEGQVLDLPS